MMLAGSLAQADGGGGPQRKIVGRPSALLLSPIAHVSGYLQFFLQAMLGGQLVLPSDRSAEVVGETIQQEKSGR